MKTVVLGDTHGKSFWKLIISIEKPDRVIFIGDYFDSWDISAVEQIHNFKQIVEYKKQYTRGEVILLLGNHDLSYYPGINGAAVSGYQAGAAPNITQVLMEHIDHFQMAYENENKYLFSHAGVGKVWLEANGWDGKENISEFVNDIWHYKPLQFEFYGFDASGNSVTQTPIWIRPESLLKTWQGDKNKPTQIVGHTEVKKIDIEGSKKWTGGKLFMIDALDTSMEYLVFNDDEMEVHSLSREHKDVLTREKISKMIRERLRDVEEDEN